METHGFPPELGDFSEQDRQQQNDLVPYWIYEIPDGFKVVRHVPGLPLSRERLKLDDLARTLAVYRMVFGKPRQEDLVNYLRSHLATEEQLQELLAERIDLAPHSWRPTARARS